MTLGPCLFDKPAPRLFKPCRRQGRSRHSCCSLSTSIQLLSAPETGVSKQPADLGSVGSARGLQYSSTVDGSFHIFVSPEGKGFASRLKGVTLRKAAWKALSNTNLAKQPGLWNMCQAISLRCRGLASRRTSSPKTAPAFTTDFTAVILQRALWAPGRRSGASSSLTPQWVHLHYAPRPKPPPARHLPQPKLLHDPTCSLRRDV